MRFFIISLLGLALALGSCKSNPSLEDLVKYVDPNIGVVDTRLSNCVIGPQLPFGSINPSPQTPNGWHDGYHAEEHIRGFGQLHVSGSGWGKYGQFLVSPQIGLAVGEEEHDSPKSDEMAKATHYQVTLDRYNIKTELVPTHHAVLYRFTFPESAEASIAIDVVHSLVIDIATNVGGTVNACFVKFDETNPRKIYGVDGIRVDLEMGNILCFFQLS